MIITKLDNKGRGITYKEDTVGVRKALKELVDNATYPNNLWD